MSTDPRQQIGDAIAAGYYPTSRASALELWSERAQMMLDALLPEPGAVVLVRHEDGTTTSSPVRPSASIDRSCSECWAKACDGPKPEPCPTGACQEPIVMWREVPDEQ